MFDASSGGKFFPISRMTLWERIQKYGKKAGIPEHKSEQQMFDGDK